MNDPGALPGSKIRERLLVLEQGRREIALAARAEELKERVPLSPPEEERLRFAKRLSREEIDLGLRGR